MFDPAIPPSPRGTIQMWLTIDAVFAMFLVCQLPKFRIDIGYLRQLPPINNIHVQHLRLPRPLHSLQMVSKLVRPRSTPTRHPKHVNLHVPLPQRHRGPSLPRPTIRTERVTSCCRDLCAVVIVDETSRVEMGGQEEYCEGVCWSPDEWGPSVFGGGADECG